jgi:adenylate kinase family enzyme
MSRILIAGRPKTGKTTLALQLSQQFGYPVRHADDINASHSWSNQSLEVAAWMESPGPYIIEGVTVVRAIRKWLERSIDATKPCDIVYWGATPFVALDKNQTKLGLGCLTIWGQVHDELVRRGVQIKQVR